MSDPSAESVSALALIGVIAAALAILAAGLGVVRWLADRWTRGRIRRELIRLRDADADLRRVVIALDQLFLAGVGWGGLASWPEPLGARVEELVAMRRALDEIVARVRSTWAAGPTERARDSVETAARGIRHVVDMYLAGVTERYVDSDLGEPIHHSATGRGFAHPVPNGAGEAMSELRREVRERLLVAALQLGPDELKEWPWARWPVREWEVEADAEAIDSFALPMGT